MIVICTPTGLIGRQVLGNVLDGGEPVRVIVRDPARLAPRARGRVEVVQGSLTDTATVTDAFAGAGSVFWLVPPDPRAESVEAHTLSFVRPLCAAITRQKVERLVYVAGLGHEADGNAGPASAGRVMDELIGETGVSHRALRAPAFMENLLQQVEPIRAQGTFFSPVSGDRKLPTCATRDIAAIAAGLLRDGRWNGRRGVPILGPEDLSYDDMAEIMSEVLQRPIRYRRVPGEAFKATLMRNGMAEAWAQGLVDLLAAVDDGLYNAEPRTPESTTPTGFRQWCAEVLKPAVLS